MKIPFAKPSISEAEIKSVVEVMKSGWLTTGKKVSQFEKNFSEYIGDNINAIAINSATAGLHLSLAALQVKYGDEIITTTNTFTATAEVVTYAGAKPVFVDIDKSTLNIDIEKIEEKITNKTKGIIIVHFGGLSVEMDKVSKIAKKHNLFIIEDSAHALPTTFNQKHVGLCYSDACVFSFYANKTIMTGEGGMVVTHNKELANKIKNLSLHGINKNVYDRYTNNKVAWEYDVIAAGYKYNMTDIAAAIGIEQLKKCNEFHLKRKK